MPDQRPRGECFLDLAVYAPIGLAVTVAERVKVARAFGELAVRFGRAEIERELRHRHEAAPATPDATHTAGDTAGDTTGDTASVAADVAPASIDAPAAHDVPIGDLPIGDYESLAAIHVVQRLSSLRPDEIEQIRRFETAHRARRTVLAKIEQLQEAHTP